MTNNEKFNVHLPAQRGEGGGKVIHFPAAAPVYDSPIRWLSDIRIPGAGGGRLGYNGDTFPWVAVICAKTLDDMRTLLSRVSLQSGGMEETV